MKKISCAVARYAMAAGALLLWPTVARAVDLNVRMEPVTPQATEVRLSSRAGDGRVVRRVLLASESEVQFTGLAAGLWEVEAHADGWWCGRRVIVLKDGERAEVSLTLVPAARLVGTASAPGGLAEESKLQVRLRAPFDEERSPAAHDDEPMLIECPISSGRFSCVGPTGLWDVRLRLSGHASRFLWALRLGPEEPRDLGKVVFVPGGSVVGWAPACATEGLESACRVSLAPWLGDDDSSRTARQTEAMRVFGRVNRRGFFEFESIAAGTYVLSAERGEDDRKRIFPVQVYESAETEIAQPLVLEPLNDVVLSVEPAGDPNGEDWRFVVHQLGISGRAMRTVAEGELRYGRSVQRALDSGRYLLVLRDGRGSQWLWEEIEVTADSTAFHYRLPMAHVVGRVLLGDEPLAARLWFGGRQGARRLQTASDPEGRFEVVLPEAGPWSLTVSSEDPRVERTLSDLDVALTTDDEPSELEVRLPDTVVEGVVVDGTGEAASGAYVKVVDLVALGRPTHIRADEDGEFSVRGLGPGDLHVTARGAGMQSDEVVVSVAEDSPHERLVLVLRETREVHGIVTSRHGPVPGALVTWYGPVTGFGSTAVTGGDGRFTARVGAADSFVNVLISPPGRTFTVAQLPIGEAAATVEVADLGGTLLLPNGFEALTGVSGPEGSWMIVFVQGVAVDIGTLREWWETQRALGASVGGAEGISLPQMPAGVYTLCQSSRSAGLPDFSRPDSGGNSRCVSQVLPPGGAVALEVPAAER